MHNYRQRNCTGRNTAGSGIYLGEVDTMKRKKITLFLILLFLVLTPWQPLRAEVYLLGRGRGSAGSVIGNFIGNESSPLHVEEVRTNGRRFELEIYNSRELVSDIFRKLKERLNKQSQLISNGKLIRYRCELPNKMVEHLLFADSGNGTVIFRILLPQNFAAGKTWHDQLPPLPGGAKSELVLELPRRNAVFGMFNNAFGTAQGNLRAVLSNLSDEWSVSADESLMPNGRGAMLFGKKKGILLVSFSDDGTGFFYLKK